MVISSGIDFVNSWQKAQLTLKPGVYRWSIKSKSAAENIQVDYIKLDNRECKYLLPQETMFLITVLFDSDFAFH